MKSPESETLSPSGLKVLRYFGIGVLIGCFLPVVLMSYVWYFGSGITLGHGLLTAGLGLLGGVLFAWGGDRIRQILVGLIESMPSL